MREYKKLKFFETKVVKVKKENKCQHQPAMVILGNKYARFKCIKCGEIYETNILSKLWSKKQRKGNWINGECIDKIKFPCFCSYKDNTYHYRSYGILIKHGGNFKIIPIEKQYRVLSYPYSEDLSCFIKNWNVHILKGKIIIFEEEK